MHTCNYHMTAVEELCGKLHKVYNRIIILLYTLCNFPQSSSTAVMQLLCYAIAMLIFTFKMS